MEDNQRFILNVEYALQQVRTHQVLNFEYAFLLDTSSPSVLRLERITFVDARS